ncbi:PspC domain-containing protein [Psychroflexus aestuariivivens]|uniref:PspC domain-containing protein n=1 Tax=Psychroflexus aestuariivivens TaxID=1795040 RepID=UPI000FDB18B5|nr:PspC domain-containing protein [Psychroflexus aestuariivivens]
MNKTININLANVFFHIDEDAFRKLDQYLKTIEKYLSNEESKSEILQDIEARIAEIFSNNINHGNEVITTKHVDEVVEIMGEPEAYRIEDDADFSSKKTHRQHATKKLYRDIDRNYIGGVSSGLSHYIGLDVFWIRLIWVISAFLSFGITLGIYILLWILIEPARTTAEKLAMQGEPVNLSNIERKVKEGYDKFADKVGDIDYEKYSQQTKSGVTRFFDGLGEVLRTLGQFLAKFLGLILFLISGLVLVSLLVSLFSFGTISVLELGDFSHAEIFALDLPTWLQLLIYFIIAAIPFFYLLILSLKLLFSNLKSIGKTTHISLLALWILAVITVTTFGVKKGLERTYSAEVVEVESLSNLATDTLEVRMNNNLLYSETLIKSSRQKLVVDNNNQEFLYSSNLNIALKPAQDSIIKLRLEKSSSASSVSLARQRASEVDYNYEIRNDALKLDSYFLNNPEYLDQNFSLNITLFIPENMIFRVDNNLQIFLNRRAIDPEYFGHLVKFEDQTLKCIDCVIETEGEVIEEKSI